VWPAENGNLGFCRLSEGDVGRRRPVKLIISNFCRPTGRLFFENTVEGGLQKLSFRKIAG
jgi:hypothetical protein